MPGTQKKKKHSKECSRTLTQLTQYSLQILKTILLLSLAKFKVKNMILKRDEDELSSK